MTPADTFEDLLRADLASAAAASSTELGVPVDSLVHDGRMQRRRHHAWWAVAAACVAIAAAAATALGGSHRTLERPGSSTSPAVVRTMSAYDARADVVLPGNGPGQADLTERIDVTRGASGALLVSAGRIDDPHYGSGMHLNGLDPQRGAVLTDREVAVVLAPASAVEAAIWSTQDLGIVTHVAAALPEVGLRAFVFRTGGAAADDPLLEWAWFRADGTPVDASGDGQVVRFSDGQRLWVTASGTHVGLDDLGGPVGGGASAPIGDPLGRVSALGSGEGSSLTWTAFAVVKGPVTDPAVEYDGPVEQVTGTETRPVPGTGWTAVRRVVRGAAGGTPRLVWTGSDGMRHELRSGAPTS